jgi:phage terminase large subunit GpA-like protein
MTRRFEKGFQALLTELAKARDENLRPPPKLTLSEWADTYAYLSRETSAQTGKWTSFGYQRGMLDAVTDPTVSKVTVMKAARIGYSQMLGHAVGYFISQDPSPILLVEPRVEDAERVSKTTIASMLRDTPVLAPIQAHSKGRDSGQTILEKAFLNGASLRMVGANSPAGLRAVTCRVIAFDEIDAYPVSAGAEGDPIALGSMRSQTFWNRKILAGSTPTIAGHSRIEALYAESDMRVYEVPCPHCGEFQTLEFGTRESLHGIKWHKDDWGRPLPETAYYACKASGCVIEHTDKHDIVDQGRWVATRPFTGHAGFHMSALYSPFVNASWGNLVTEWLRVKDDPLARQTFYNLVLGLPYQDRTDAILEEHVLAARAELWPGEVPSGVGVLTCGMDVQADRVELEVVGWGKSEESWSIAHEVIEGDTSSSPLWDKVDGYLKSPFSRADGRQFEIMATCIDSGFQTQTVYGFCRDKIGRRVYAVKGESVTSASRNPIWPNKRPSKKQKGYTPFVLGINAAKDLLRSRLALAAPTTIGDHPGVCHFPVDRDIGWYAQLIAERLVTKSTAAGRFRVWELLPGRRNEALDCRVYAMAALQSLITQGLKLNARVNNLADEPPPLPKPEFVEPQYTPGVIKPAAMVDTGQKAGRTAPRASRYA